jgi:hypothetical protein
VQLKKGKFIIMMGSKYQIIILFLLSANAIFGQNLPRPINHMIKNLQKKGADTILVYMSGCDGCEITNIPTNCTCLNKEAITDVHLIFQMKGEFYKEDFTCCQEFALVKMNESLSISYFLSLRDMLRKRDAYYKEAAKHVQFFPPIPTDNSYEEVELIVPGHNYKVSLFPYQINEDYKIWKQYFWIDREIKLLDFVRKDIGIHITRSSVPID